MSLSDIEGILESIDTSSDHAFSFSTATSTEKMQLTVKDVGEIKFPVNKTTIKKLIKQASPALFGYKDRTIYDPKVRNTWELNKSQIKIDMRKWKSELAAVLEEMASALFPEGTELTAELHNMLVYEPGQFFKKHQDSEKTEDMQASLVVILPTKEGIRGGKLSIEHGAQKKVYGNKRASTDIQHVGFYADCIHEVSKVTEGHRLALTFNVSVKTRGAGGTYDCPPELIEQVQEYFKAPLQPKYNSVKESTILCVLAHQYTPKSLNWNTLKGNDIAPAYALKAAAEKLGLEVYLGSFEYKVTYDVVGGGDDDYYGYGRRRRYQRHYHEDDYDDDEASNSPSDYETGDLICDEWSWLSCVNTQGNKISEPDCSPYDASKIELGDIDELEAADEEYEGYTGNAGNTLDRMYHRAGVVIRDPQAKAFKRIVESPLKELERIEKLKNTDRAIKQLEKYYIYASCFPLEKKVVAQIIKMCMKFKRPDLLTKLISEKHYHLLFELSGATLLNLDADSRKAVDKMISEFVKNSRYGASEQLISLLKACIAKPALCDYFAYFIPNFITAATEDIESIYSFDREKYVEQVKNACMVLDFALQAGKFKEALPLLEHIQKHPLAYPAELFVLHLPPNSTRIAAKKLAAHYKACLKELQKFLSQESSKDAAARTIPLDGFSMPDASSKRGKKGYFSYHRYDSAPAEKTLELLAFLRSDEVETRLQLFKKDQSGICSLIRQHALPVEYHFGSASSRYYVDYEKDLKASKKIRLKRILNSKEAIALLEASTKATKDHVMA